VEMVDLREPGAFQLLSHGLLARPHLVRDEGLQHGPHHVELRRARPHVAAARFDADGGGPAQADERRDSNY
jgi:hypothetical protein